MAYWNYDCSKVSMSGHPRIATTRHEGLDHAYWDLKEVIAQCAWHWWHHHASKSRPFSYASQEDLPREPIWQIQPPLRPHWREARKEKWSDMPIRGGTCQNTFGTVVLCGCSVSTRSTGTVACHDMCDLVGKSVSWYLPRLPHPGSMSVPT